MSKSLKLIDDLAKRDGRYKLDAYLFVQHALHYAQHELDMGGAYPPESYGGDPDDESSEDVESDVEHDSHLSGQQLCEAARLFAAELYGRMAKVVLNSWGVNRTRDFGEIVYNLIEIGEMTKSDADRLEDFDDVYEFEEAFHHRYEITMHDEPS